VIPTPDHLPNLLYLGNVPVESSYHGSALLYRLLSEYPPEKLLILEGSTPHGSQPARRLSGVSYGMFPSGFRQLLRSLLLIPYGTYLISRAKSWWRKVDRDCAGFAPQAVLTVAHGPLWLTAAAYAHERGLPLHFICHDDIRVTMHLPSALHPWMEKKFAKVYKQAASRLCVSTYMRDDYDRRFGVSGTVLHPSRASGAVWHDTPPARLHLHCAQLRVAYGGTVNSAGHYQSLQDLAIALQQVGGQLLVFGLTREGARSCGLAAPNIEPRGLVSSSEMIKACREEADALAVSMSFDLKQSSALRMGFPSKLTDYTAAGLPLLIHGPADSSAVRWARENAHLAEIVTEPGVEALLPALRRLQQDATRRVALAQAAIRVGGEYFPPTRAREVFLGAISRAYQGPSQSVAGSS
jgi:hypothetical protein